MALISLQLKSLETVIKEEEKDKTKKINYSELRC